MDGSQTKAGFAAFIGASNAGKSTLLNQLLGEKLSIVTQKAQTTRMRVLGILTEDNVQVGLIDTPGIFKPKAKIDRAMVNAAWESLEGADAVLLLVDAARRQPDAKTEEIIEALKARDQKVSLVLNKIDLMPRQKLLPLVASIEKLANFDEIFMISAKTGDGVKELKAYLKGKMPEGPWLYPEDQLTDLPERLLAAETTREQCLIQLQEELPYQATVVPESWEERQDGSVVIRQRIVVTKANHRQIVLGKGGARIKAIGSAARAELSSLLGRPVHLFLDVQVDERWQDRADYYELFGLELSK